MYLKEMVLTVKRRFKGEACLNALDILDIELSGGLDVLILCPLERGAGGERFQLAAHVVVSVNISPRGSNGQLSFLFREFQSRLHLVTV